MITLGNASFAYFLAFADYLFRFHNILYNAQALRAEENRRPGTSELEDTFFLHPVRYDEEVSISVRTETIR